MELQWLHANHFCTFYLAMLFASYFKFYGVNFSWGILILITITIYYVNYYLQNYKITYPRNYFGYGNISCLRLMSFQSFLLSVSFFMIFSKIKIYKCQKFLRALSELSFGEYLIATPDTTFYQKSWIISRNNSGNYYLYTKYSIIALIKTFIVCAFIEYIRSKIVKLIVFNRKYFVYLQDIIDQQ